MRHIRRHHQRGRADFGWLQSHHSFSFGSYFDPKFHGFSDLLVINDDRVRGGAGFPTHPHRDMEIISFVVEGELSHRDTLGNGSTIRRGDVQVMGAGSGISHSEFNSGDGPLRFLQIWIRPEEPGGAPRYAERAFAWDAERPLQLVVSPDGAEGSLMIQQDARIYRANFARDQPFTHQIAQGRYAWLQVIHGELRLGAEQLSEGDAIAFDEPDRVEVEARAGAEYLWFDLKAKGPHPWH